MHNRKLWMFCYDKVGAQASANLFSLVMIARANGVEPFEYLSGLFKQLPAATTVEGIEALLPWNLKNLIDARRNLKEPEEEQWKWKMRLLRSGFMLIRAENTAL